MNMYHNTIATHNDLGSNDEIDLLEVLATLWRGKWLIAGTMIVCLLPTVIWLSWQAPVYKLEATLDRTSAYDIQPLQPTLLPGGPQYQVTPLNSDSFYQAMLAQAGSLNTHQLFWEQRSKEPLFLHPNDEPTENEIKFRNFFDSLVLTPPNPKTPEATLSYLTLETAQPAEDTETLTAYVDFLNARIVNKFVNQLEMGYDSNLQQLKSDYDTLLKREQQKLEDSLLHLEESLSLARSLNIVETPYEQLTGIELKVVDDRQYLLGTRVLTQEIKSLQARTGKPLSAFVPQLRDMEYYQKVMESDLKRLQTAKADIKAFDLASPVVSSLDPIKPKKMLVLLGAVFLSGIIGIIIVFIIQGIKSYQSRPKNNASTTRE